MYKVNWSSVSCNKDIERVNVDFNGKGVLLIELIMEWVNFFVIGVVTSKWIEIEGIKYTMLD